MCIRGKACSLAIEALAIVDAEKQSVITEKELLVIMRGANPCPRYKNIVVNGRWLLRITF